jgi:hypothetical protein
MSAIFPWKMSTSTQISHSHALRTLLGIGFLGDVAVPHLFSSIGVVVIQPDEVMPLLGGTLPGLTSIGRPRSSMTFVGPTKLA